MFYPSTTSKLIFIEDLHIIHFHIFQQLIYKNNDMNIIYMLYIHLLSLLNN